MLVKSAIFRRYRFFEKKLISILQFNSEQFFRQNQTLLSCKQHEMYRAFLSPIVQTANLPTITLQKMVKKIFFLSLSLRQQYFVNEVKNIYWLITKCQLKTVEI